MDDKLSINPINPGDFNNKDLDFGEIIPIQPIEPEKENVVDWVQLIQNEINLSVLTKVAPTKGNITYEYNPFYNYRIQQNMYEYQGNLYTLAELWSNFKTTLKCRIIVKYKNENKEDEENDKEDKQYEDFEWEGDHQKWDDYKGIKYYEASADNPQSPEEIGKIIVDAFKGNANRVNLELALKAAGKDINEWQSLDKTFDTKTNPVLREAGELTDFITNELSFDLEHPVSMLPQYSYDGSVNLILNDGKNQPKLINSRFSATGRDTYEVCDRKGNNDTNIYDQGESFNIDTSLYKQTVNIPNVQFHGLSNGGALEIGNYHFYFKLSDADGNESDFIAESGLVSVFMGFNSYSSVTTGERNENSNKQAYFQLSNLDSSYDYVHVYYSRYTAENDQNRVIDYVRIDKNYLINNSHVANIYITGFEDTTNMTAEDINMQYNVVDSAYTQAICQNMLFMANVHKPDIPYEELQDLSLRILPYLKTEHYNAQIDRHYNLLSSEQGYIDPKFIYEKTGYWTEELYRLGIVYIMNNNTLSPVFNIRGGCKVGKRSQETETFKWYSDFPLYDDERNRLYITSDEENYKIITETAEEETNSTKKGSCLVENVKGVVSFQSGEDTDIINSIEVVIPNDVKEELMKYAKGYFFVRQPRIPSIIAQGITIGINKESNTPTIPTKGGIVDNIKKLDLSKTHVTIDEKEDEVVYASEGFLSRYVFKLVSSGSSIWKKIGVVLGVSLAIIAIAAATVLSFGTLAPAAGATVPLIGVALSGAMASTITIGGVATGIALGTALIAAGAATVAAAATTAIVATVDETVKAISRIGGKRYNRWETKIPNGYKAVETSESRLLTNEYDQRVILTALEDNYINGILCPDFELDQPHFNEIFIGDKHLIKSTISQNINFANTAGDAYFENDGRHFYVPGYFDRPFNRSLNTEIVGITDNQKLGVIKDLKFKARAGEAEEAFRIESVGDGYKSGDAKSTDTIDEETVSNKKINSDIIRGSFGPYLGFYDKVNTFGAAETVNIYVAGYDPANIENDVYQRCLDSSTFHAISDRYLLDEKTSSVSIFGQKDKNDIVKNLYRGDCYICQFTHRVNRNFQDPSTFFNDEIIEETTWKDNYDPSDYSKMEDINRADVNAVQLGTWVTFRVRSSYNLNIRTQDCSHVEEYSMTNSPRTYYPKSPMSVEGVRKIPESSMFNAGFKKGLSERYNFEVADIPWVKNWYGTRIMYSNLNVSDSFQNGFRVFRGMNYRDYTREYGNITKIVSLESSLLCVFEHGVALIPVNERAVAGEGAGGFAYINTSNVLPENPKILSDVYGSQWADSVLKVPGKFGDNTQYIYGVDTVAKKIWRTDGNTLTCISDFKVQEFLNNNISLSQRELTPKLGIRNVKTIYNAFKRDVLFTFYDNTYGFEEKVWNLCWNELLQCFVTFYSWVPSFMENINNIPFSFNRNTSKWIAKLGTSHTGSSFADGITLSNVIISNKEDEYKGFSDNYKVPITYKNVDGGESTIICEVDESSRKNLVGVLNLSNRSIPEMDYLPHVEFVLERDNYQNYKLFQIKPVNLSLPEHKEYIEDGKLKLPQNNARDFKGAVFAGQTVTMYGLYLKDTAKVEDIPIKLLSEIYYRNKNKNEYSDPDITNKWSISNNDEDSYFKTCIEENYPIWVNSKGNRENLPYEEQIRRNKIVTLLNIKADITYIVKNSDVSLGEDYYNGSAAIASGSSLISAGYYESVVAVIPKWNMQFLSTDFWKHGQAGIFNIADKIFPTKWYGEQHPFEFEFIVADQPGKHKIFDNLQIISNKAEPDSFHYEIVGECYEFAKDKKNMYIRQEATKELYQYNGSDIGFDHDYTDLTEARRDLDTGKELEPHELSDNRQYDKSTLFPLYYGRQDTINEIYDSYCKKDGQTDQKDFSALSGAELVLYRNLDELRIWNHCQAVNISDKGILRGNMQYIEDLWNIQINPINYVQKNEPNWNLKSLTESGSQNKVPIEINTFAVPDDIKNLEELEIPKSLKDRSIVDWGECKRQEVKVKDKYLKVRIRYSGKDLAIINAINTLYSISYA